MTEETLTDEQLAELSEEERLLLLYQAGNLRFLVQPHQLPSYDGFQRWNEKRQTREYLDWCAKIGAQFDNLWLDEWARRVGKTAKWLIIDVEQGIKLAQKLGRGVEGLIAIPEKTKIGGIIVPNAEKIFRDAPHGYKPEYMTTSKGRQEHLYIPACETRITLVGLDHNPDALRGPWRDFMHLSEGGYIKNLYRTYVSELQLQMQGADMKHAFAAIESSTPKQKDHDFNIYFKLDAQLRGTYSSLVITDNTSLTEEEIADEIRRTGGSLGRESPDVKRELFNENDPDPDTMVCPEFDEKIHVVDPMDWPQPLHAIAVEGLDPGTTDPFGICWMYLDYERQTLVVQGAWQRPNASTGVVVETLQDFETEFWGTSHNKPEERDLPELDILEATKLPSGQVWVPPPNTLTYWDSNSRTLLPNPYSRISDVAKRMILDMNADYKLNVRPANKEAGTADADLLFVRELFRARHPNGKPKVVILRNGRTVPLIQQLRSGMWNTNDVLHRTDWLRSKVLGHLDSFAAFKYGVRDVPWLRDPRPPILDTVDRNRPGVMGAGVGLDDSSVGSYNQWGERQWR